MNMTQDELIEIVKRHGRWLLDEDGGRRANLSCADLSCADLSGANLLRADLRRADLSCADLSGADLRRADLLRADLRRADLSCADLSGADLRRANLRRADLSGANLSCADLSGADLSSAVGGNSRMQCLQIYPYKIIILDKETVWGGCAKKTAQEWLEYAGEELSAPDRKYLETITKPFIRMCLAISSNQE